MPGAGSCFTPHGATKGQGLFFAALGGQWPRHREVTYFSQDHTARKPGSPGPEPTHLAATLRGHVLDPPEPETTLDISIHTSKVDTCQPNLQMRKMRVNGVRVILSVTPGHLDPCVWMGGTEANFKRASKVFTHLSVYSQGGRRSNT